jgi:hypothetical protein
MNSQDTPGQMGSARVSRAGIADSAERSCRTGAPPANPRGFNPYQRPASEALALQQL